MKLTAVTTAGLNPQRGKSVPGYVFNDKRVGAWCRLLVDRARNIEQARQKCQRMLRR
jgi:hypothetical protein